MHYYPFHVSDYIHDTAHLSNEEDLAFRRLLDLYYTQEKPIPNKTQEVARRIRMAKQIGAVQTVLEEFFDFDVEQDYWYHKRCDETIATYQAKAERNRQVGKLGGRPKSNPQETQVVSKQNPNQEPITNNQEPKVKTQRGSRLPTDWSLPQDWKAWAENERPDLLINKVADSFKDFWISKPGAGGVKLNWEATWRNWIRSQSAPKMFANKYDVAHVTTPPPPNQDAALRKIEEDRKRASKPNAEMQAKIAQLLKGNTL
jgi:uncharacterized protein YdaU (DUF1376 family)